jgi:hypothetical protein
VWESSANRLIPARLNPEWSDLVRCAREKPRGSEATKNIKMAAEAKERKKEKEKHTHIRSDSKNGLVLLHINSFSLLFDFLILNYFYFSRKLKRKIKEEMQSPTTEKSFAFDDATRRRRRREITAAQQGEWDGDG